ncbi:MAG: hypothetical protein AAF907_02125, partial [Planctomycetota bacterium]
MTVESTPPTSDRPPAESPSAPEAAAALAAAAESRERLTATIERFGGDRTAAEDAVAEAFLAAARRWPKPPS